MKQYRCIKRLVLPMLDEPQGNYMGEEYPVEVGEVWDREDEYSAMLTHEDGSWLDIEEDTLEEHFEELDVKTNE